MSKNTKSSSSSSLPDHLRDEKLTQETRVLMSYLPSEKGWVVSNIYEFQGIWHTPSLLQGTINCQKHFQAKDSDIFLVTIPKSGTTWLKALVFALLNRNKFPVSSSNHPLRLSNPHLLMHFLEGFYSEKVDFPEDVPSPRLLSTHISYVSLPESVKNSSCKILYCCRNPKDMFVSLWHFGKKLAPQETENYPIKDAVEAFCKGKFIYGPFWEHVLRYWYASKENPEKVHFVTYEALKKNTGVEVMRIAEFLGCCFTEEERRENVVEEIVRLCSFESLSNFEVNKNGKLPEGVETNAFFRKGEIGGWRDTLSESLAEEIDKTINEKFRGSGLQFS